ncbi:MAG: hypothetical protein J1F16_00925 [Muribaculaceae bacterium]|nr:hypothetical protein [Muribaculaceae bacterium]
MKRHITLGLISLWGALMFAQTATEPVVIYDATARKISSDGKWVACYGSSIVGYNVQTKQSYSYPGCSIGIGNSVALDGTIVGDLEDEAVFMKEGSITSPAIFSSYQGTGLNGITPNSTRIVGILRNPVLYDYDGDPYDDGIIVSVPFYADMSNGNVEKINILPYPEKDFLGFVPQNVTAEWISSDGKTILGKITDSYGRFEDPIVYHENSNGEWNYITPTKEFVNPNKIVLPENPWAMAPPEPKPRNYMSNIRYQQYLAAIENALLGGGTEPNPLDYMTPENAEKYLQDCIDYDNYFLEHKSELDAYDAAYTQILKTSTFFHEYALNPNGKTFVTVGLLYDEEDTDSPSKVYIFNTETGTYQKIESQYSGLKIYQVLSNGTVLAYTGLFTYDILMGYILLPGASDFIPFADYLAQTNPEDALWLDKTFPNGEGIISASDDLTVVAGGVDVLHAPDPGMFPDSTILSYILPKLKPAGIESIEIEEAEGVYKVYNLMGVKVLQTKDKAELKNLDKGIYIINGKKIAL